MTASERRAARLTRAHERARRRGASGALYALVRAGSSALLRTWFRVIATGTEHVPARGATILAANHKSFLDAFFVGICTRRHVHVMAKAELFRGPLGWLFLRLGVFPVRRGESDDQAMRTAEALLEKGCAIVVFPEGTRVDDRDALGAPHHGAGRLALESGAAIVPVAIAGTQRLWLGPVPKPRCVQVAFLPAIDPSDFADRPDALAELIDRRLWPAIRREYGRELTRPGLALAALAATGLGARLIRRRQERAGVRLLGVIEPRRLRRRGRRARWREIPRRLLRRR